MKKNQKKSNKSAARASSTNNKNDLKQVDPRRIRFQHSKIRPYFSGCGRSVTSTLDSIRRGELSPGDLPPIQVRWLVGCSEWKPKLLVQAASTVIRRGVNKKQKLKIAAGSRRSGWEGWQRSVVFLVEQSSTVGFKAMSRRGFASRRYHCSAGETTQKSWRTWAIYYRELCRWSEILAREEASSRLPSSWQGELATVM